MEYMVYIIEGLKSYVILLPCLLIIETIIFLYYKKHNVHIPLGFLIGWQIFACYMLIMLYITSPADIKDFLQNAEMTSLSNFELTVYQFYNSTDQPLNIILFIPFGILLPMLWKQKFSFVQTICIGFLLSLSIEVLQLFNFRASDMNDILTNTIGTFCGYIIFWLFLRNCTVCQVSKKRTFLWQIQPLLNVLGMVVFYFFIGSPLLNYVLQVIGN